MDKDIWRDRISNRSDMAARITHLTRGATEEAAFELLWKILLDKKILASGNDGYIVGHQKAVCFQEVPLYSIAENLMFEKQLDGKNRYSWFGLRFNKQWMFAKGARPVIYGKTLELKNVLREEDYWRIVNLDLESEHTIDWSHEREWRILGDYSFEYNEIEVLVQDDIFFQKFVNRCIDENRMDILKEIHGVIPLNTVIS